MNIVIYKDRMLVGYMQGLRYHKLEITKKDIVELELRVETADTTGKAITGAIMGNMLAGGLGAIAMAGQASKAGKQDFLHLVINYKGEHRPLVLQTSKNTGTIYMRLKEMN